MVTPRSLERGAQVLVAHQERDLVELLAYARQHAPALSRTNVRVQKRGGFHANQSQPADQRYHAPCSPPDERPRSRVRIDRRGAPPEVELDHTSGGRAAKTLAKTDGLRVTLVLLKRASTLNPESTAGGASLHVLEGRVRVQAEGEQWDLGPHDLIVLGDNLREPVTAMEEAAFLVTVAWPAGAGASEHEGADKSR